MHFRDLPRIDTVDAFHPNPFFLHCKSTSSMESTWSLAEIHTENTLGQQTYDLTVRSTPYVSFNSVTNFGISCRACPKLFSVQVENLRNWSNYVKTLAKIRQQFVRNSMKSFVVLKFKNKLLF